MNKLEVFQKTIWSENTFHHGVHGFDANEMKMNFKPSGNMKLKKIGKC